MKLLKIGRDNACDIRLSSDKVSSLHAEIVVRDNGDIVLTDKGSTNGTFVMNKRIMPGKDVSVKRGDMVRFADTELDWTQVPMQDNLSKYKAIYSIGSKLDNEIVLMGNTVSRYHATIKKTADGKVYIQDHSTNGTTVNGMRIKKGEDVRIKKGDAVVCGGVPVDLDPYMPKTSLRKILVAVAVAAVICGIIFGVKPIREAVISVFSHTDPVNVDPGKPKQKTNNSTKSESSKSSTSTSSASSASRVTDVNSYIPSVVMVRGVYHYVAKLKDDPFAEAMKKYRLDDLWDTEYKFGINRQNGNLDVIDNEVCTPIAYTGTAFFISKDGQLMTNRHVAQPWAYITSKEKDAIIQKITEIKQQHLNDQHGFIGTVVSALEDRNLETTTTIEAWKKRYEVSEIEITGELDYLGIAYPNRRYTNYNEFDVCSFLKAPNDINVDLAVIQLNSKTTPSSVTSVINVANADTSEAIVTPQKNTLYYIGYPAGTRLNLDDYNNLTPLVNQVSVNRASDTSGIQIHLQGEVLGGASGSPILSKDGRLVGIVNASYTNTTNSLGVLAKYAKDLVNK